MRGPAIGDDLGIGRHDVARLVFVARDAVDDELLLRSRVLALGRVEWAKDVGLKTKSSFICYLEI